MPSSMNVFIIDDDPDDRELLVEAIHEIDPTISCDSAIGSLEALAILSGEVASIPDYIFLDMNMPLMDGKECLVEIKKIEKLADTKLVIYTTSQREEDVKEMLALGASFFLIKPSIFAHLKKAVQCILLNNGEYTEIEGLFK
jgi:CheY-like chemotaxis protein